MSKPKSSSGINIPDEILRSLLTASELRMLKNRWQIIHLLNDGLSVRKIAAKIKVGTDTVIRVARMAEKENLRASLKNKNPIKKFKTNTSWIFGKSN